MNEDTPPWAVEIIQRLARIEALLNPNRPTDDIFRSSEAARYVKHPHPKAFYRFRVRTGLKSYSKDRYSRHACDVALAREQRGYRKD